MEGATDDTVEAAGGAVTGNPAAGPADPGAVPPAEATAAGDGDSGGWYGVRCVFRWTRPSTYEERITLWEADSLDDAIAKAEAEARVYADRLNSEFLDIAQAYWIGPDRPGNGSEAFSLMRDSTLDSDDYLDAFYDTGRERQRTSD
ncbi:MAG TPA: hypothetical protein VHB02_05505 [Acidimicrobiales bacterium]|nr:hypothetical protein [Acidimicrobiales bacterium]